MSNILTKNLSQIEILKLALEIMPEADNWDDLTLDELHEISNLGSRILSFGRHIEVQSSREMGKLKTRMKKEEARKKLKIETSETTADIMIGAVVPDKSTRYISNGRYVRNVNFSVPSKGYRGIISELAKYVGEKFNIRKFKNGEQSSDAISSTKWEEMKEKGADKFIENRSNCYYQQNIIIKDSIELTDLSEVPESVREKLICTYTFEDTGNDGKSKPEKVYIALE